MIQLSKEQNEIVKYSKDNNIIVDSVAGSGKSTTIEGIINENDKEKILLLMYNNKLRKETIEKLKNYDHCEIHTYHSFGNYNYIDKCYDDNILNNIINNDIKSKNKFYYDRLILDESQDVNEIRYNFTKKIINDNDIKNIKINILGDKYQCIYNYDKDKMKRSNKKFCTNLELFNNLNNIPWKSLKLSNSFRLNNNISNFINRCMLNKNRIISDKNGDKPYYYYCNPLKESIKIFSKLIKKYNPEDIFILTPTFKSYEIQSLCDEITSNFNIKISLSSDKIKNNKNLLISTYHASKGLERKAVMVFGFDESNFIQKKNNNKFICPNEFYVATSRATEELHLIHNYKYNYLQFLNKNILNKYTNMIIKKIKSNRSY